MPTIGPQSKALRRRTSIIAECNGDLPCCPPPRTLKGTFLLGSGVPSSATRPDNHAEINAMSTIDPATLAQIDLGIKKKQAEKNADTSGMIAAIEAARQAREGK